MSEGQEEVRVPQAQILVKNVKLDYISSVS